MDPTYQDPDTDPDPQHWFVATYLLHVIKHVIFITICGLSSTASQAIY
jgi:hypothetical protein